MTELLKSVSENPIKLMAGVLLGVAICFAINYVYHSSVIGNT